MCNSGVIEDEIHFVIECSKYHMIRLNILGEILQRTDNLNLSAAEKLCMLMNDHTRKLAKFVVQAFMCRRDTIYIH